MSRFAVEIRPVLLAVSKLSGPSYAEVDEGRLKEELRTLDMEYDHASFSTLMFMLRDDEPGDLRWHRSAQDGFNGIRLTGAGRQEVEGWPTAPGVSSADLEALLSVLAQASEDPDVPEEDRSKLRAVGDNLRGVGSSVASGLLTAWLKSATGMG